MSPSYGEPNAHETTASTGSPPSTSLVMAATASTDSSVDIWTFFWLYVSDADTVTVSPPTPASIASSAPRRFGTSAQIRVPGGGSMAASTSAAPAIDGTARGDTN